MKLDHRLLVRLVPCEPLIAKGSGSAAECTEVQASGVKVTQDQSLQSSRVERRSSSADMFFKIQKAKKKKIQYMILNYNNLIV